MAESTAKLTLRNGETVTVNCLACGESATQSVIFKLCKRCVASASAVDSRKPESQESDEEEEPEKLDQVQEDVEVSDTCYSHGEKNLTALETITSAIPNPLHDCNDSRKAEALILTWLNKSSHEILTLFMSRDILLGTQFVLQKLTVVISRLEQTIDYGIENDRWHGDKIPDGRVRSYRQAAKNIGSRCKELRQKIKHWNAENVGNEIDLCGSESDEDPITQVEQLSDLILNAKRPMAPSSEPVKLVRTIPETPRLQPTAGRDVPMADAGSQTVKSLESLFGDLSMFETKKTGGTKPNATRLASEKRPQPSSWLALPRRKLVENGAPPKKSTRDQRFVLGFESSVPVGLNMSMKDPASHEPEAPPVTSEESQSSPSRAATSQPQVEEAKDEPFPLPNIDQDQVDELQMELNIDWELLDEGFPQWKKHDPLRMELLRRQKQLEKTSLVHVRKRAWIAAEIEKLQDILWQGR